MWGCFGSPETDDDKPDKVLYNYNRYLRTALGANFESLHFELKLYQPSLVS